MLGKFIRRGERFQRVVKLSVHHATHTDKVAYRGDKLNPSNIPF
mgnify:CR=1 FL=1